MAENLNYGVFTSGAGDQTAGQKYCYDDDPDSCLELGGLYQWHTALGLDASCDGAECEGLLSGLVQGACPPAWHVPTASEWRSLVDIAEAINSEAAYVLKSTANWATNPSTGIGGPGTDDLGFSAVAGGGRYPVGYSCAGSALQEGDNFCWGRRFRGMWWTTGESSSAEASFYDVSDDQPNVARMDGPKSYGLSLRCIQD